MELYYEFIIFILRRWPKFLWCEVFKNEYEVVKLVIQDSLFLRMSH